MKNNFKIAHVTSFLPKRCGIATYSVALQKSIRENIKTIDYNFVIDDIDSGYDYRKSAKKYQTKIAYNFWDKDKKAYLRAANKINQLDVDLVDIQHEFGLYGARVKPETLGKNDGENIILLMKEIKKPIVTTLHMVYKNPPVHHKEIVNKIFKYSKKIVLLSKVARQILVDNYPDIDVNKIVLIPHGAPDIKKTNPEEVREKIGCCQKDFVISSFGYIRSKKGYEYLIKATALLKDKINNIKLLLVGETHPQRSPEYKKKLDELIVQLKIEKRVKFIDKFVDYPDLLDYLMATDIFVAPFLVMDQVSSGTLIYAMAAGKACLATPFDYAKEALADNRGILVPPKNAQVIAEKINYLYQNAKIKKTIENRAYNYARQQTWQITAQKYIKLFQGVINEDGN